MQLRVELEEEEEEVPLLDSLNRRYFDLNPEWFRCKIVLTDSGVVESFYGLNKHLEVVFSRSFDASIHPHSIQWMTDYWSGKSEVITISLLWLSHGLLNLQDGALIWRRMNSYTLALGGSKCMYVTSQLNVIIAWITQCQKEWIPVTFTIVICKFLYSLKL